MPKPSKLTIYVLVSVAIAAAVSYKTFSQPHVSFSLGFTRLTNSKLNNAILFNCIFSIVLVTVNTLIKFFFGEMREIERYDIIQWTKQKVLSFAFIMIVLHDELITSHLIVMFVGVLAWSIFHWLTIKRSEYLIMENQGNYKGHIKISILFGVLAVVDILLLQFFYASIFTGSDTSKSDKHLMALIGFEVLILLLKIGSPLIKYFVNLVELLTLSHFEKKSTILSICEFLFTITALLSELWLFYFIYKAFGTPLHLILEAIETIMSLVKTTSKFYSSIVLVRKFNKLPDVTKEDIKNIDSTCLICLHEITHGKKIPCGHIFHLNCLKGWIQGNVNQFCPKCKQPIKIDNLPSGDATGAANDFFNQLGGGGDQNMNVKLEKLSDLNFGLDNLMIMKLYNEILLKYVEKSDKQFEEESHQEVIKRIYSDLLIAQESGKDQIGALEYGLPRPAVSYKSPEAEELRKKAKLVNYLLLSQYGNHAFFKLSTNINQAASSSQPEEEYKEEETTQRPEVNKPKRTDLSSILAKPEIKKDLSVIDNKEIYSEENKRPVESAAKVTNPSEDDPEAESIRRRQILLEAIEKRNAMIAADNENKDEDKKNK